MRGIKRLIATAAMAIIGAGSGYAATVVDQEQAISNGLSSGFSTGTSQAQTFTVGTTGTLTQIDFLAVGTANFSFDIRKTTGGQPDNANVLQTVSASLSNPSDSYKSIALNTAVTMGDVLAFVVYDVVGSMTLRGATSSVLGSDPYSGGSLWTESPTFNNGLWYANGNSSQNLDLVFRTYVDDGMSSVPLPAGLPLLLVGLGGFGLIARSRRTAG